MDQATRTLTVRRLDSGEPFTDSYDILVLATGVSSVIPPIPGIDSPGVFTLRSPGDAEAMRAFVDRWEPRRAVIVGAGHIGLELTEQLVGPTDELVGELAR